jgi:hypothetical protein
MSLTHGIILAMSIRYIKWQLNENLRDKKLDFEHYFHLYGLWVLNVSACNTTFYYMAHSNHLSFNNDILTYKSNRLKTNTIYFSLSVAQHVLVFLYTVSAK